MPGKNSVKLFRVRFLFVTLAACLLVFGVAGAPTAAQTAKFDVNDVSFLWPVPSTLTDVAALVTAEHRIGSGRLWPQQAFEETLNIAQTVTVESSGGPAFGISFGQFAREFLRPSTWKLVAIRVDPSAPGIDPAHVAAFGSRPQIRLVLQPVTVAGAAFQVHDVTAHLAFSFVKGFEAAVPTVGVPRAIPDTETFKQVVSDLSALKAESERAGITTAGPLRVHPALVAKLESFRARLVSLLERHLTESRLTEIAFMGIRDPEPWIFFALQRSPGGKFERLNPPSLDKRNAQMLILLGGTPVVPTPTPKNMAPNGVSTAKLFERSAATDLRLPVFPDLASPLIQDIPDIVANPRISHVFNTDCVSCHTETTRRHILRIASDSQFRYSRPSEISGADEAHLARDVWNVRNFGWFPDFFTKRTVPSITVRTANEAAESADYVNREYLSAQASPSAASVVAEPVARPLTLIMRVKSPKDFTQLKSVVDNLQKQPSDKNPVTIALNRLATVHFARFAFIGEEQLAVITTYDGSFERYINAFINEIGGVFDQLLAHIGDAPPLPVSKNRDAFLEFVRKHDLTAVPPFYSAYPGLSVLDVLTLQKQQVGK